MSKNLTATFYVQFRRVGSSITATTVTQNRPKLPRRGVGAIVVKFAAEIPSWVFDPLDLIATTVVPAEITEPLIRLEAVGPIMPSPDEP